MAALAQPEIVIISDNPESEWTQHCFQQFKNIYNAAVVRQCSTDLMESETLIKSAKFVLNIFVDIDNDFRKFCELFSELPNCAFIYFYSDQEEELKINCPKWERYLISGTDAWRGVFDNLKFQIEKYRSYKKKKVPPPPKAKPKPRRCFIIPTKFYYAGVNIYFLSFKFLFVYTHISSINNNNNPWRRLKPLIGQQLFFVQKS